MTWTVLLPPDHPLTPSAWEAVAAIADDIKQQDPQLASPSRPPSSYEPSLLYAYLALAGQGDPEIWRNLAITSLNAAIERAGEMRRHLGLFGGLAGLGWTIEHLSQVLTRASSPATDTERDDEDDDEDANADVDSALMMYLRRGHPRHYDLITGLVGIGIYFCERLPAPTAAEGVRLVFDGLERLAEQPAPGQVTWHTPADDLPEWQRELCPAGYYNLGVAHGVPGVLFLLNELAATNLIDRERLEPLLAQGVTWLLAQQRPPSARTLFGSWVVSGVESADSRLAWCYGDLGILGILAQLVQRVPHAGWQPRVDAILNHCLAWPVMSSVIIDAPLCHGAIGVAHIFNRFYQTTGDLRCHRAAVDWYERTLAMRQPGTGIGGFVSLTRPDGRGPMISLPSVAFLDGALGIALALLAALTPIEPEWDRLLLLSGRPTRAETNSHHIQAISV
jgi:hypothetical protein